MPANLWKIEYHLIPPGAREAVDWLEDEDEAIKAAEAKGPGWMVEEVRSYLDDRSVIFTAGQSEDEEQA